MKETQGKPENTAQSRAQAATRTPTKRPLRSVRLAEDAEQGQQSDAAVAMGLALSRAKQVAREEELERLRPSGSVYYVECHQPECLGAGLFIHKDEPFGPMEDDEWEASYHYPGTPYRNPEGLMCQVCLERGNQCKLLMLDYGGQWGPNPRVVVRLTLAEYLEATGVSMETYKKRFPKRYSEKKEVSSAF